MDEHLSFWTQPQDKFELEARLRALPVPAAAVQKPAERIEHDPSTGAFGLWPTVPHSAMGDVTVDGQPVHFSDTDGLSPHGGPCLGEHTREVLTRLLGYDDATIDDLYEEGVL